MQDFGRVCNYAQKLIKTVFAKSKPHFSKSKVRIFQEAVEQSAHFERFELFFDTIGFKGFRQQQCNQSPRSETRKRALRISFLVIFSYNFACDATPSPKKNNKIPKKALGYCLLILFATQALTSRRNQDTLVFHFKQCYRKITFFTD